MEKKLLQAIEKSRGWGDRIPVGIFYQNETIPTYEQRISERIPSYPKEPPAKQQLAGVDGKSLVNLRRLSKEMLFESLLIAR